MGRLLLIDDEADVREVARLTLETLGGWEVIEAATGASGLGMAVDHRPDVILLDVMLPDVDGWETCRRLRQVSETKNIPVILFTAKANEGTSESLRELGIIAVIQKPFDPQELPSLVAEPMRLASLAAHPADGPGASEQRGSR